MSASCSSVDSPVSSWAEICQQYPNEWVLLLDVEDEPNGMLRTGRLFAHDPSVNHLLDNVGWPHPTNATIVHTWNRPLRLPLRRVEVLDELGNAVPFELDPVDIEIELDET